MNVHVQVSVTGNEKSPDADEMASKVSKALGLNEKKDTVTVSVVRTYDPAVIGPAAEYREVAVGPEDEGAE